MIVKKHGRRTSLSLKLYILIAASILTVSLALLYTGYRIYSHKVEEHHFHMAERALKAAGKSPVDYMENLVERVTSEEYRLVREKAIAENDEGIIESWLRNQPGMLAIYIAEINSEAPKFGEYDSLYGDIDVLQRWCRQYAEDYGVEDIYLQYMKNGVTYNLIDPNEDLFHIGSIEEPLEEFAGYGDNEHIPPTIYHSRYGWLCTTCDPIISDRDGRVLGSVCVDINMDDVMNERKAFLLNSLIFVLAEIAATIVISMLVMRRSVTRPLKLLAKATKSFARDEDNLTKTDVIQLPIRSRDELGELYHEIQSMQNRIVDYTDHLTRITAEKERVQTEMSLAAQIQTSMLPRDFQPYPDRKEFSLFASMDPAREVGGDFYDFFPVDDDHLCLVIADVSGKGVPAALFMMASRIIIYDNARMGKTPAQVLYDTNMTLCASRQEDMFITIWIGILEISTGKLIAADGGHEYPAIMRDSRFELYREHHGFLVGGLPEVQYRNYEIQMKPGDKLFVYTDGVPEAQDSQQKMFGLDRMCRRLNDSMNESPEEILTNMRRAVDAFVGDAEQFDDLTMLCIEYKGKKREPSAGEQ